MLHPSYLKTPKLQPTRLIENTEAAKEIASLARLAAAVRAAERGIAWVIVSYWPGGAGLGPEASAFYRGPIGKLPADNDAFAAAAWRLEHALRARHRKIDGLREVFGGGEWSLYFGDRLTLLMQETAREARRIEIWTPLLLDPSAHARLEVDVAAARADALEHLFATIRDSEFFR